MDIKQGQKMTYLVNTALLAYVLGMLFFFAYIQAKWLVLLSVGAVSVYITGYYLIHRAQLDIYVWLVYVWITFYMYVSTICLGSGFGFSLYCMSMIPVAYVIEYMAYKMKRRRVNTLLICMLVIAAFVASSLYLHYNGPLYVQDASIQIVCLIINSLTVFSFLIVYSGFMLKLVISSEEKLLHMAHRDKLTGLYNRHYITEYLNKTDAASDDQYLAMIDIDSFKRINDTYGHNAGDYILSRLAQITSETYPDFTVCRWGGEEFLISFKAANPEDARRTLDELRLSIAETDFLFDNRRIPVTITIGISSRQPDQSIDSWIQKTDDNLYLGKKSGKNKVVLL